MDRRSTRGRGDTTPKQEPALPPPRSTSRNVSRRGGAFAGPTATRGRSSVSASSPAAPAPSSSPAKTIPRAPSPILVPPNEVPAVGGEEIVLNRRGTPARARKRNRFYFDDNMVTPENWGAFNKKKVKQEPEDLPPEEEDDDHVEEEEEEEPEHILGNVSPDISSGPPPPRGGRRGQGQSPQKKTPARIGSQSPMRQPPPPGSRTPRPSLQLHQVAQSPRRGAASPERPPARSKLAIKPSPAKKPAATPSKGKAPNSIPMTQKIKPDPDASPPEVAGKKKKSLDTDQWGKLVQRTQNLKEKQQSKEVQKPSKSHAQALGQGTEDTAEFLAEVFSSVTKPVIKNEPGIVPIPPLSLSPSPPPTPQKKKAAQSSKGSSGKEKVRERDPITTLPSPHLLPLVTSSSTATSQPPHMVQLTTTGAEILGGTQGQRSYQQQQQDILTGQHPQHIMAVLKITDPLVETQQNVQRRVAHDLSIRLRNLLKLPKAHKWVCYEWFYSNIDKVLFEGENDFQVCLKESFPGLKARKLTRTEWTKIRRLMGKPRRCSQSFFDEEREELARRRSKIRQIQQRKMTDFNYKELPDEIPLQLVIGTKVTARLRRPQDGIFTGTIEGVDTSNNTYRITFDRSGLGTHSIPDYEVLSNDSPETVSTSSFALKIPRRTGAFSEGKFRFQNPALLGEQPEGFPKSPFPADGMLGGFPIRLLDMIVRLSKLLKAKREKIMTLKELNVEAEKMKSYGRKYGQEYARRYAKCVLDLDSMNKEMSMYLERIQTYCLEITNDSGSTTQMIIPEQVQESAKQEANMVVSTYNCKANRTMVHNQKIVSLVHQLTGLLLQVRSLSISDRNQYELKSLKDTLKDVKASLEGKNLQCFQNKIEIPMNRIIAGLGISQPKSY